MRIVGITNAGSVVLITVVVVVVFLILNKKRLKSSWYLSPNLFRAMKEKRVRLSP